jgi:hypothetical protein
MIRDDLVELLRSINVGTVRLTALWEPPDYFGKAYYRADNGYWLVIRVSAGFPRDIVEIVAPHGQRTDTDSTFEVDPLGEETLGAEADIYQVAEERWGIDGMWVGGGAFPVDEHPGETPWDEAVRERWRSW